MSTTKDHGDFVFQCDGCRTTLESNTSNFESARNVLRRHGWKPYREGDGTDWKHRCADCAREHASPQTRTDGEGHAPDHRRPA